MTLVTVVIPSFNAAPYIERTLLSVMAQSHRELEIVVVNDGSTDETAKIVQRLADADPRVRLITVSNGGVARARNIGIDAASADFVAFVDADDLWHRDKIELQLTSIEELGPDYGGCFSLYRSIDLNDYVIHDGPTRVVSGYIYARHISYHFVGNGSSLLVRRAAAQSVGGFDPWYADRGIGGCEDLDFELRLASKFKIHGLPLYLVGYRRYEGNMSSNYLRMSRSMRETIKRRIFEEPILPPKVIEYARASVLDYTVWVMIKNKRVFRAMLAMIELLFVDLTRGAVVISTLTTRVAEHLGLKQREKHLQQAGSKFYDFDIQPVSLDTDLMWRARLNDLGAIDDAMWASISGSSSTVRSTQQPNIEARGRLA